MAAARGAPESAHATSAAAMRLSASLWTAVGTTFHLHTCTAAAPLPLPRDSLSGPGRRLYRAARAGACSGRGATFFRSARSSSQIVIGAAMNQVE